MFGCDQVCVPTVWPEAAIRRTSSGYGAAFLPIKKKVACTHSWASAASTRDVVGGQGPSSKVRTTSWSASGSDWGKLFKPTRGVVAASTARTRAVPSVPGRGHWAVWPAAAEAGPAKAVPTTLAQKMMPNNKAFLHGPSDPSRIEFGFRMKRSPDYLEMAAKPGGLRSWRPDCHPGMG